MKELIKRLKGFSWFDWSAVMIVVAAAVIRFYNLEDSQQFLGDQGRDALVVSGIFKEADPVFIGPVTSVGNMYLGPLYYYFMLPFLWLSYPSPMGPVYAVALLGVITVALTYITAKRMFSPLAGLLAAAFLTFSSVATAHTRFSWNPNPMPLVGLLMAYFTFLAWKKDSRFWMLTGLMFAVIIQLHYVAMLTAGAIGVVWLISLYQAKDNKRQITGIIKYTFFAAAIVLASLTPLFLFDMKHEWLNSKAFADIVAGESALEAAKDLTIFETASELFMDLLGRAEMVWLNLYFGKFSITRLILLISAAIVGWWYLHLEAQKKQAGTVLLIYLLTTIAAITLYKNDVYDHYVTFIFPVVFIIYGAVFSSIIKKRSLVGWGAFAVIFAIFLNYNFHNMPFYDAGWKISDIRRTAENIHSRVKPGEKYNIVLFAHSGDLDGQNYRYFLHTMANPPVDKMARDEAETLFIIDEEKSGKNVLDSPAYEIVVFEDKVPKEIIEIPGGPIIYVLKKN